MPKNEQKKYECKTERCSSTANTPASYPGGTEFEFWPENMLFFMCAA